LKKPYHKKIRLVEWLKVKAPSSSPSTRKKRKKIKEASRRVGELGARGMQGHGKFSALQMVSRVMALLTLGTLRRQDMR
jgi:hypothetical protein